MSIYINKDYEQHLASLKPTYIVEEQPTGTLGDIIVDGKPKNRLIIPPVNADIRLTDVLPRYKKSDYPGLHDISVSELPENFSWGRHDSDDSTQITNKKKHISTPGNQLLCGSCWAYSTSRVISDNFVTNGLTKVNPKLSATYCLSCYSQGRCNGGNPAVLLTDIEEGGIKSDRCLDYSWCQDDQNCSGDPLKHFHVTADINDLIPPCECERRRKDVNYPSFYIQNPSTVTINNGYTDTVDILKKHIYLQGPIIGTFIVLKNFINPIHTQLNGGVYLENHDYQQDGTVQFIDDPDYSLMFEGGHSVSVMGWGVAKNILVDNNGTRKDVPYWHVRNSWDTTWGDNGYFKMAMYPFNKIACIEKITTLETPQGMVQLGGAMIFDTEKAPNGIEEILYKDKDDEHHEDDKKNHNMLFIILGVVMALIVAIILIVMLMK